jgi:hypothetical protein
MLTLSISDLRKPKACDLEERIEDLTQTLGRKPEEDEELDLKIWWSLKTTSVDNRFWSLRAVKPELPAQQLAVLASCRAARRVLPLVPAEDQAVCLAAIEAAEAWVAEPTKARAKAARLAGNAAWAVYAAARSAAYTAAYAAYASRSAARSAAYTAAANAANAANAAADAAARAAADAADAAAWAGAISRAERQKQREDLDELLEKFNSASHQGPE